jgi:hypothetical protein
VRHLYARRACFESRSGRKVSRMSVFAVFLGIPGNFRVASRFIGSRNVINCIRSQTLRWLGHVYRMNSERLAKEICEWKPLGMQTAGRPKNRWEDDVMRDLKSTWCVGRYLSYCTSPGWWTMTSVKQYPEKPCSSATLPTTDPK